MLIYTVTVNSSGGYIVCLSLLCFYISYCISCDCIMHSSPSYTILKKNVELDCYQIKENKTTIEADWSSALNIRFSGLCGFESKLMYTHARTPPPHIRAHTRTHARTHICTWWIENNKNIHLQDTVCRWSKLERES